MDSNGQKVVTRALDREPIFFGDGTRGEVLERIGIQRARCWCSRSRRIRRRSADSVARHLNPKVHIVARTRYVSDMEELYALGANEVVPEEFETSLEIFAGCCVVCVTEAGSGSRRRRRGGPLRAAAQRGTSMTRVDGSFPWRRA
jgi:hypothetical protein